MTMVKLADLGVTGGCNQSAYAANQSIIQGALNSYDEIVIPDNDSIVTLDVHFTKPNQRLIGNGDSSILTYVTGAGGICLDSKGFPVKLEGFKVVGSSLYNPNATLVNGINPTDKRFMTNPIDGSIGLRISGQYNSRVRDVTFQGFGGLAVKVDTDSYVPADDFFGARLKIRDCYIYDSYYGLYLTPSGSCEYTDYSGTQISNCGIALTDQAGNVNFDNMTLFNNRVGLDVIAYIYSNNSHSNFSNGRINHHVDYAVRINGATVGYNLIGNQIHLGNIHVEGSYGVNISDGTIHVGEIQLKGGGRGKISNNFMFTGVGGDPLVNTVTHNYGGVNDAFAVEGNFTKTTSFANSYGGAY